MSKKKKQSLHVSTPEIQEGKEIIILTNPVVYWLDYVLIVTEDKGYRLVVCGRDKILTDKRYRDVRGAKIAFLKYHQFRAVNRELKPVWSGAYAPDKNWLDERIRGVPTIWN
jgi:hypothetical protein